MKDKRIIFYDVEVFHHNWMVVFIDYSTRKEIVIVDEIGKLRQFYNTYKNDIWVGYNSRMYDQYIIKAILMGLKPKTISDKLIVDGYKGFEVHPEINMKYQINNFDTSTGFHSLKQLEGFMGEDIRETTVDFNIDRPLTESEIEETISYCRHDVQQTINVFEARRSEFDAQLGLIEAFGLDPKLFSKTKAQLSSIILDAQKPRYTRDDEFDFTFVDTLRLDKYIHVKEWFEKEENKRYNRPSPTGKTTISIKQQVDIWGVPHDIGYGGIHGAIKKYSDEGFFVMSDIASMYPATMINYNFLSRNVHDKDRYRQIRDKRIVLKRDKDPRQGAYKIVLNSTYGASKDKFNNLYDPLMANNVCITGQLLIVDLLEKLEEGLGDDATLVQSNTDGILVKLKDESIYPKYLEICKEWEIRSLFELEHDIYVKVIQKDVNNYVIVDEKGKYKSKGSYVKKLSKIDYDLPIVNRALVNYLVDGIPIENTINNCDSLIEFQKISKITSLYRCAMYKDKEMTDKVYRVFASRSAQDGTLYKIKGEDKVEKVGNTPERCFIDNSNIIGKKVTAKLDKQWYINLANKRLKDFIGGEKYESIR